MRIGIDASGLGQAKTGTTVYLTEILAQWNQDKRLAHSFVIFVAPKAVPHFTTLGLDERFQLLPAPDQRAVRVVWQQTVLPLQLARHGVQVHWGPGFALPLAGRCPMVVTIHDLTFQLFPAAHEPIKRYYFPYMIGRAVRKARAVLAISETTRADLETIYPGTCLKTRVTLLAPRRLPGRATLAPVSSDAGYALFIGTLEPRKNLPRLLAAWRSLAPKVRGGTELRVIGATGWLSEGLNSQPQPAKENIHFLGSLSDDALASQLYGASFFVYPSLYEGFGLPVLEAMAAGIPVLTSDVGATREVAANAALLADPSSIPALADGLARLLQEPDLRQRLRAAGLQRAAAFSWAHTARQTLDTLVAASGAAP